jgi:lipopolysaccharide/colanic/teichoic acid biosynthesis glycosyltransferase
MKSLKKNINKVRVFLGSRYYSSFKRTFDLFISFMLLPIFLLITAVIFILNIFFNKGKLYFIQKRMGKNCQPFFAIKFRTMESTNVIKRKYSDPLEVNRITTLGYILRKTKIDELPQILNVIKGEMSLIGPRPDYYEHALSFIQHFPNYQLRHTVRPGISGLSQIRLGYAEGLCATKKKLKVDLFYIKHACIVLDLKIFFGTIYTILHSYKN